MVVRARRITGRRRQFMEFVQSELLPQYAQLIPGLVSGKAKLIESGEIRGAMESHT